MKLQYRHFLIAEAFSLIALLACLFALTQIDPASALLRNGMLIGGSLFSLTFLASFCGALFFRWQTQSDTIKKPHIIVFWLLCGSLLIVWAVAILKTYLSIT